MKDGLRPEYMQRSIVKMIRMTESLGNKCRFKETSTSQYN